MKTARAVIVWLLLPLGMLGALALSAAATINLFQSQGFSEKVAPAGMLMLEVTSLAGTVLWVFVGNASLRRDARWVTFAASGLAMVAGAYSYGLVGLVANPLLVAITHLASRAWREPWDAERQELQIPEPSAVQDLAAGDLTDGESQNENQVANDTGPELPAPADEAAAPVEIQTPPATVRQLRAVPTRRKRTKPVSNLSRECVAMTGPSPAWPEPPASWEYGTETWRSACEDHYRGMGRPAIATKYQLAKPNHARQVTDAVRPFKQQPAEAARA